MMSLPTIPLKTSLRDYDRRFEAAIDDLHRQPDPYEDDPGLMRCTDPVRWIEEAIGAKPWEAQRQVAQAVAEHPVVCAYGCHAWGKTKIAADIALWAVQTREPVIVVTTAPTDRQVKRALWREIRKSFNRALARLKGKLLKQELYISEDCLAFGFTARENASDNFQGFHEAEVFIIVDESSGVSQEIFDAIDGISTGKVHQLHLSNPLDAAGPFAKLCRLGYVKTFQVSAFDTPNLKGQGIGIHEIRDGSWRRLHDPERDIPGLVNAPWVAMMMEKHGEDSVFWLTRVDGRFADLGEDTLIPLRLILAAQECVREIKHKEPVILGVDVARFGRDETVIVARQSGRCRVIERSAKGDLMDVCGRVVNACKQYKQVASIHVDDTGLGGGVTDRLRELRLPVMGVVASAKAVDEERYSNRRAEMFDALKEALLAGDVDLPDDGPLGEQLANIKIKGFTSKGQMQLESKADMKKRMGGKSPDDADALALCFAPVQRRAGFQHVGNVASVSDARPMGLDLGGW